MWFYVLVFLGSLVVDLVPLIGPPAWTVMVFFHLKYQLNIWWVLVAGVTGSALGRYLLALYMPYFGARGLNRQKDEDLFFLGNELNGHPIRTQAMVLLYTLMPLPSTPLFTVAGLSKMNVLRILPAFFAGKFISDAAMVFAGKIAVTNMQELGSGLWSWETVTGAVISLCILLLLLFMDWQEWILRRRFRLRFRIWKTE